MFKERPTHILMFCFIVSLSAAVLQYLNPGILFFDYGLIIAVLLTVFLKSDFYTKLFGTVSVGFIIISGFYRHDNMNLQQVMLQHLFSATIIVTITLAVLYIKKLYRSIESDERQVNALFEHATEGIVLTNSRGEIILVNPAASELFLYDKEEVLGKPIETLIPIRFHDGHEAYRRSFYQTPSNRSMGHGRDLFARKKNGQEFPVEVSLSYYHQEDEFFVIAFVVDITSRKESEMELRRQKKQLETITEEMRILNAELENKVEQRTLILREALQELEKSETELSEALSKEKELSEIKSRFVSMASHEFRTPLSTVLSSASLLSKYTLTEDQEKRDKHIKRIKDSVRHLNELLEDFLSLGKLEEGRIKADLGEFNAREFVTETVDEIKSILKSKQAIHFTYDGSDLAISDKLMVKNILINLLGNASKFSADDSPIWLTVSNLDGTLRLQVRDEGIGISDEDQQHLFSSFFRAKNVVNIEGTGLGLHIVKRYVELLNGSIRLKSQLNQGTSIDIELPSPALTSA